MATTTKAVKANAKNTKADAKKTATDAKKTTKSAISVARTTAENVQRDLVDTAGDVKESVQNVFLAGLGALSMAEEEGSKFFNKLVKKGEKVELPGLGSARIQEVRKQLDVAAEDAQDAVKTRVSDAKYVAARDGRQGRGPRLGRRRDGDEAHRRPDARGDLGAHAERRAPHEAHRHAAQAAR